MPCYLELYGGGDAIAELLPLSDPASELPSMVSVGVAGRSPTSEATKSSRSRRAAPPALTG